MKIQFYICTLIISSLFMYADTPPCHNSDRIDQQFEILTQKMLQQQQQLELLTKLIKNREITEYQAQQNRLAQAQKQEEQQQEFINWFQNLPAWKRYSLQIFATVHPFVTDQLWPTIKAQLTMMLARKIVEGGLNAADFCTGTLPEKAGMPIFAFRFGEWVTLDNVQRQHNTQVRKLHKNPEYSLLKKRFDQQINNQNFVNLEIYKLKNQIKKNQETIQEIVNNDAVDCFLQEWKKNKPNASYTEVQRQKKVFERYANDPKEAKRYASQPNYTASLHTEDTNNPD